MNPAKPRGHSRQKSQQQALIDDDFIVDFQNESNINFASAAASSASPSHPMGEENAPALQLHLDHDPENRRQCQFAPSSGNDLISAAATAPSGLNGVSSGTSAPAPHQHHTRMPSTISNATFDPRRRSYTDSEMFMAKADEIMQRNWWLHPKLRDNYKLVIGSTLLTIIGLALLITSIVFLTVGNEEWSGWVFLAAGLLCFIPGIYHVVYIWCVVCGKPGYNWDNLPTFSS